MMPFLVAVLLYVVRHPSGRLVVVAFEPIPLGQKYHPMAAPLFRLILGPYSSRASLFFSTISGIRENLLDFGASEKRLVYQMYGDWGADLDFWTPDGPSARFS